MNILALQGLGNTGKTATIKKFAILFENAGAEMVVQLNAKGINSTELMAKYRYQGLLIGVCSAGDTEEILKRFMNAVGEADLCVVACRTKGETIDFLCDTAKDDLLLFLRKRKADCPEKHTAENEKQAERILAVLRIIVHELKRNGG